MSLRFRISVFVALAVYSLSLLITEVLTSQEYVRQFFADISGDVPFYGVNTTLSAFLLWSTAIMFSACISIIQGNPGNKREYYFFLSQIFVFLYLGLDERFQIHDGKAISYILHDKGDLSLFFIGLLEASFLWKLGRILQQDQKIQRPLFIGTFLFALMVVVDLFLPNEMVLRLSMEDLLKSWANVFFFLFAWAIFKEKINILKDRVMQAPKETRTTTNTIAEVA